MLVEITTVTITEDKINLTGNNLESILLAENFDKDIVEEPVQFEFDRKAKGNAHMKYLWKVVSKRPGRSMSDRIERLAGAIINIGSGFIVKE